ncbi:MAG: DNA repair protein RadA [Candidatus Omnitrophota bacterium]|nr:MAG: DNA repair protein RadA [Candidatus Omnitrophota bacterium]
MFICANCGYQSLKWLGKCPSCGMWQSFEEKVFEKEGKSIQIERKNSLPFLAGEIRKEDLKRIPSGIKGFDELLGGGLVEGEIVLVGGEPGVGKSTLLLEVGASLSFKGKVLYICAEESAEQVKLRAERLGLNYKELYLFPETDLLKVYEEIKRNRYDFLIVDSIQVVHLSCSEASSGGASQIRECANFLTQIAKGCNIVVFVVGHVTKEGIIAGPKLLEHIVDCVLYFESEVGSNFRILRITKNRFGPAGEIAVFEMTSRGIKETANLGRIFLPHKDKSITGSSIVCIMEGRRPIIVELQALVSKSSFGMVKRRSLGFDFNRFSLLLAVIEKRLKINFSSEDVFFNVSGGLRINDPSADLGAALAIISSYKEKEITLDTVFIGEVGLSGEIRPVANINLRIKEIEHWDFRRIVIPEDNLKEVKESKLEVISIVSLKEILKFL